MCGEHLSRVDSMTWSRGSSPHVRGTHVRDRAPVGHAGIIPACAGNTGANGRRPYSGRDHPRMCGEHHAGSAREDRHAGSSPHVRGTPYRPFGSIRVRGIIPACAGNTQTNIHARPHPRDHPRMCGEHPPSSCSASSCAGSSPHVRGTH